jgi:hypothetical protein
MWLVHLALVAGALYVAVISGMYVAQTWLLFPTTLVQAGHGLAPPRLAPSALWASQQLAPSPSIAALSGFSAGRPHRKSSWIPAELSPSASAPAYASAGRADPKTSRKSKSP